MQLRACVLLVASLLAACSTTTDCPPAASAPAERDTQQSEDAPLAQADEGPRIPAEPELVAVTADDGHALHMWRLTAEGVDDPPAILLIHGRTWSSAPDFDLRVGDDRSRSLAHNLAAAGYAVYGLDLRGYGQTKRDASGWLEPDRAVEDLAAATAVIREREGEAPDLLGWSNGALVAHLYAQRHAEGLGKLVLYGYPRDPDVRAAEAPKSGEPARAKTTAEAARSDFITPGTMPEAAADAFVEQALAADPVRADWRSLQQFDAIDPAALTSPTLVIHGVHDPYAKQLWMAKLFTRMKVEARQWVMLPNADHAAHLEHPEAFTRALLAFLAD